MEKLFVAVIVGVLVIVILTWLTMIVWNMTIPSIFVGAPQITFWQALGLNVLGSLLTGSKVSTSREK